MLFQSIVDQIKTEARIKSDSSFDVEVASLITELFKEAVESQRPFELRQEVNLPLNTAQATITLPTDFFIYHRVYFQDSSTGKKWILSSHDDAIMPAPVGFYGHPKSFQLITGNQIALDPVTSIVSGDSIDLIYYQNPPTLTVAGFSTQNPIPRLEPFLIRAAIRRVRMLHSDDVQVAQMISGDVASAAKGYTNDEPKGNP